MSKLKKKMQKQGKGISRRDLLKKVRGAAIGATGAMVFQPLLTTEEATAKEIRIPAEIEGTVNDSPLAGLGAISFVQPGQQGRAKIRYPSLPSDFTPVAVSTGSLVSVVCCVGCKISTPISGVLSLFDITEGQVDGTAQYAIRGSNGNLIGEVRQEFILKDFKAKIIINGWYAGPLDLIGSPGYEMRLHQREPGKIIGTYTQIIFRANGDFIRSEVTREYVYDTELTLPFDEIADFTLTGLRYEPPDHEFTFLVTYWPAVEEASP